MLSIDGVGAYDHVLRSSMMTKLLEIPSLRGLLPFVRSVYGKPSCYKWRDSEGVCHDIHQHEGGEQGDPLMPLLFSLAIHDALCTVQQNLLPDELLFAFLDDVYVVSRPGRTREVFNMLGVALQEQAGNKLHGGKTRVWNKAGVHPPNMQELGPENSSKDGLMFLCTPVGSDRCVEVATEERLTEEARLWEALAWVSDLQCAGQILLQCAGPKCPHFLRTLPPRQSAQYAEGHDRGMRMAMQTVLGSIPRNEAQQEVARQWATLPMLGLRSASRTAPAAYWASWADALPMLSARLPGLTDRAVEVLTVNPNGCLREMDEAASILDRSGFVGRPGWREMRARQRPPQPNGAEPGEWQHGLQNHGSSSVEYHFRESVVFVQSCPASQAHLKSHSGAGSSAVLHGAPTSLEFKIEPHLFRALVLERLRLRLDVTEVRCECGIALDVFGRHRAASPRSGRLRTRAVGPERTLARVCREAGATVRTNTQLRDMNVAVDATDERAIVVFVGFRSSTPPKRTTLTV